jgi:hypothetical protein
VRRLAVGGMLLGFACNGADWIVGEALPEQQGSGEGTLSPELLADPASCPSAATVLAERARDASVLAEHVGRWRGRLDGHAAAGFPSTELELELAPDGAGTLTFEGPPATSPELDPDAGYLCAAGAGGVVCGSSSGFIGNFAYPLAGAQSRDGVLSFVLLDAAPWDDWCALQPPVHWPDASRACGLSFGVRSPATPRYSSLGCSRIHAEGADPIDCALMYALEHCECASDACFATDGAGMDVGLALSDDGDSLSGSLWYQRENDAASVSLRRLP